MIRRGAGTLAWVISTSRGWRRWLVRSWYAGCLASRTVSSSVMHAWWASSGASLFPRRLIFRASEPLELVHADLCSPINLATPAGNEYFLLCVDDYSRYMTVHLLEKKSDAGAALKKVQAAAELELNKKLRVLHTDRGGDVHFCLLGRRSLGGSDGRHRGQQDEEQCRGAHGIMVHARFTRV